MSRIFYVSAHILALLLITWGILGSVLATAHTKSCDDALLAAKPQAHWVVQELVDSAENSGVPGLKAKLTFWSVDSKGDDILVKIFVGKNELVTKHKEFVEQQIQALRAAHASALFPIQHVYASSELSQFIADHQEYLGELGNGMSLLAITAEASPRAWNSSVQYTAPPFLKKWGREEWMRLNQDVQLIQDLLLILDLRIKLPEISISRDGSVRLLNILSAQKAGPTIDVRKFLEGRIGALQK